MKDMNEQEKWTSEMIAEVEKLHEQVQKVDDAADADNILADVMEEGWRELSGMAADIFHIWRESGDKQAVARMFYEFTGTEFDRYLMRCVEEMTRRPSSDVGGEPVC